MTKDKYPLYGLAALVGSALAIWSGMPPIYLLFLACPVMMFFMMSGMNSSSRHDQSPSHGEDEASSQPIRPGHNDGPRDRIDRP